MAEGEAKTIGEKMQAAAEPATKMPVRVHFLYPEDPQPISHIHFVRFSQLGGEILMDVGVFDDRAMIARLTGENPAKGAEDSVSAYVMARFGMSANTFALIRSNIDQLWEKMRVSGALKQLGLEDSGADEKK